MESSRRFKPPWTLVRENSECYVVQDANGVTLAWLYCRDDTRRYSFGVSKLSSDEARRIGKAIARIPEFLMPRQDFYPRGGGNVASSGTKFRVVDKNGRLAELLSAWCRKCSFRAIWSVLVARAC